MLKFKDDFETTTMIDPHHLSWNIENYINTEGEGGAKAEISSSVVHSGTKSLLLQLSHVTVSRRCQLNIGAFEEGLTWGMLPPEYYVSVWLFLSSKWDLYSPSNPWYELANLIYGSEFSIRLHVHKFDDVFKMRLFGSPPPYAPEWDFWNDFSIPRGRWFKLSYYVKRDLTDGEAKVWFDDTLIFDVKDVRTEGGGTVCTVPAKIYHATDDFNVHNLWVDDIELHDSIPVSAGVGVSPLIVLALLGLGE